MNLTRHLPPKPAMTKLILLINQPLSDIHDEQFSLQSVRLNASKLRMFKASCHFDHRDLYKDVAY